MECEVDVGGFSIAYTMQGEGPPLLLVPGVTMSALRWVEAGYVEPLAASHRVLAVDPLGHGRSSKTADVGAYARDRLVEHLVAVLDDANVEDADVWGYSRGSAMSGLLARAHPDRVRRLVVGGYPLFERNTILESLGMLPDRSEVEARHQRCLDGDWDAYWEAFPLPLPDATKAHLSSRNDLASISACAVAAHLDPMDWNVPTGVETLAYWGDDEIFDDLNAQAAADQPISTATVPGGHAEAFFPSGPALAVVTAFLDSE